MQIFITTNRNGGSRELFDVESGLTLGEVLTRLEPDATQERFLFFVNRQLAEMDQILRESDEISITPRGVRGERTAGLPINEGVLPREPMAKAFMKARLSERRRMELALEIIDERARSIPPEIQAEMLAELQKGIDENRMSPRKLSP